MADYPLKQEAAEVQTILDTSLTINNLYPQILSEADKEFVREKIGASAVGDGIKILSHFDTLDELTTAITSPKPGDAFSVGSEVPYNLYIYDFMRESWRNYGPIRANDIKARFAQNIAVPVSAWQEDTTVFPDYSFKARIALTEASGNDFPIIAFAPADAISGNFCPIAYCFDGHAEIWAKAIPGAGITLPAATFIVQNATDTITGNSTKGITNASGGVAAGGIGTAQIANESITVEKVAASARTQGFEVTIPTDWDGDSAPYTRSIALEGILKKDRPKVFYMPPAYLSEDETHREAFSKLFTVDSEDGVIIFTAKEKTEVPITVYVEVSRI